MTWQFSALNIIWFRYQIYHKKYFDIFLSNSQNQMYFQLNIYMFEICGVTDSKLSDVSWKQGSITKSKTPCEWGKTCLGRGLHFKKIILRHQWSSWMIYTPNSKYNFLWIYQWTFAYLYIPCVPEYSVQSDFLYFCDVVYM